MPYEEHPEFSPPNKPDAKIWRYMDFKKFLSMLENQALFFSRLDVLAGKDPYEGLLTNLNARLEEVEYSEVPEEIWKAQGITEKIWVAIQASKVDSRRFVKRQREFAFVNSWCVSEHESAAMWPLYTESGEGIAVQSTFNHLVESLASYGDFDVHIGEIRYLDYNTEAIPQGNVLSPLITKRKGFEHEKELRALIWNGKDSLHNKEPDSALGLSVPVDLNQLIDNIYVSPESPQWFLELVVGITKKYEMEKSVIQSDLMSKPLY
jgi:hypothetical protein